MAAEVTVVFRDDDPMATESIAWGALYPEEYLFWVQEYLERIPGISVMSVEAEEV